MTEQELLVDCLKRLNGTGIDYMLTGSMVSNYWGVPRTTHDLDFVIQLNPADVSGLVRAFESDFHIDELSIRSAFQPPHQFNAIDHRSALKVDFWVLTSVSFEREMFRRRVRARLFGEDAWICTAEDVILHKLYWNKLTPSRRQLQDAAHVWLVQGGNLDLAYIRDWAGRLGVTETLEEIRAGHWKLKET